MTIDVHVSQDPALPQVFGRYLLLNRLSRGGMGEIFTAKHGLAGFEKLVVIKKVLPHLVEDEAFIKRFIDEAQVAIKLQHANIAQVFEVGQIGHEYFLALEFVEGRDVRRILKSLFERDERLPIDHALFIGREIASGLAYAHRRTDSTGASLNLVHCDISPPNIMVSFEGETKIIDFGIAKSALRRTATDPKLGFGKFGYMSPEQLVRGGVVDHRTDIYAAGVVLFELLTGRRMYEPGETPDYRSLARMVTRGEHPMPSHHDGSLAPYDELVARALRPDPNQRYQRAAEFRDAIQTAQVAVNPAMNHDHLGSFMRYLFTEDLLKQRSAMAQALAVDLEPFERELTMAGEGTVTFAVADLPLRAGETEVVTRSLGPIAPTNRRRTGMIIAAAAAALLIGGAAIALVGGDDDKAADGAANAKPNPGLEVAGTDPVPTVGPLPDPVPAVVETSADAAPAVKPKPKVRKPKVRKPRVKPKPKVQPAGNSTDKQVSAKFKTARREYSRFRKKFGERLARDWTDLLSYAQYAKGNPEKLKVLDKKIDKFRRKMKAEAGG